IEYYVSGDKLEVVDIPVGYKHNIEKLGDTEMVTIMWVNEIFYPNQICYPNLICYPNQI
ncbi:hypothetical protein L2P99_13470, partial [Staphylococcus aureus]|nr:hypothetical protein [Staphylococcus aureus]